MPQIGLAVVQSVALGQLDVLAAAKRYSAPGREKTVALTTQSNLHLE
jgi:hypothetical protein